jgi:hypothetical protein
MLVVGGMTQEASDMAFVAESGVELGYCSTAV